MAEASDESSLCRAHKEGNDISSARPCGGDTVRGKASYCKLQRPSV